METLIFTKCRNESVPRADVARGVLRLLFLDPFTAENIPRFLENPKSVRKKCDMRWLESRL